jgi:hypothetical protein
VTQWYIARGENRAGPYPLKQLRVMAGSGSLSPDDRICRHDQAQWTRAAEVPHVFEGAAAEWVREVRYFGPEDADERDPADFSQRFVAWWVDGVLTYFAATIIASQVSNAINFTIGI